MAAPGHVSTDLDRELFHHLRTQADAVMVGAGTVRDGALRRDREDRRAARQARAEGLEPDPLAVIVSGRLDLPADLPLLHEPGLSGS